MSVLNYISNSYDSKGDRLDATSSSAMPRGTKRKLETPSYNKRPSKKIKLDLKHDAREENQLPDELVLQLLRLLERSEVVQCSMVCRQWYRIGQREEFQWTFVTNLPLIEDAREYPFLQKRYKRNAKVTYDQRVEELKLWQSDPLHLGTPVRIETKKDGCTHGFQYLYDIQNNLVAVAKICARNDFDFSNKTNELLWRYTIEQSNESMEDYTNTKGSRVWKVSFFVNLKQFDLMAEKNHKTIPNADVLLQAISEENDQLSVQLTATCCFETFVNRPLKSTRVPQKQPDGFKDDIKLFKYQLDAITWMKSVEDQIGQGERVRNNPDTLLMLLDAIYTSADRWRGSKTYFDKINKEIVPARVIRKKHFHKEKIRGGILADEVGLGKTFEVLGLVLASPPKADLEPHPSLIASKSTLIMCPEHLCQQWHDEITRATTLSALVVRNYDDLEKCTYEDFMTQYDVIVCAYELLSTLQDQLPGSRPVSTSEIKKLMKKLQTNQQVMNEEKCPIIEHFFFHRVVFDEGHLSTKIPLSQHIVGRSKWIVSAKPFDREMSKHEISWFFGLSKIDGRVKEHRDEMMYRDYVWRNTKESVKDEFAIPEPIDDVVYIELSPIERVMYTDNVFSRQYAYEACCTYMYTDGLTNLAKARIRMIGNRAGTTDNTRNMLDTLKEEIQILPEQLAQATTSDDRELIEVQQRWGTKVAAILGYLKKLFREQSESRVIIYSRCAYDHLETVFNKHGVPTASIKGDVFNKVRAIEDFKKKEMAPFKVIMMNSQENSAGTNMIEATHVLLLDPPAHNQESFETQAIGRAYRQGQTKQITVVRILFKDTVEHENYLKRDTAKIVRPKIRSNPSSKKASYWHPDSDLKVKEQLSKILPY